MQHRGVARCNIAESHGATSESCTVRYRRVARCEVRVLHRAKSACRTVRCFWGCFAHEPSFSGELLSVRPQFTNKRQLAMLKESDWDALLAK